MANESTYPKKVDWDTYKFRCSMLGDLLAGPRWKEGQPLQKTTISALRKIYMKEVWGFEKQVTSRQMEKGEYCEPEGIKRVCDQLYNGIPYLKNQTRFENEYICGTPDLNASLHSRVHDIKSCWDLDTFMNAEMTASNEAQIRGYMWLLGYGSGQIDKVLISAPEHIYHREMSYLEKRLGDRDLDPSDEKAIEEFTALELSLNYDRVPEGSRIKSFVVTSDPSFIEKVKKEAIIWRNELKYMTL